MCHFTKLVLEKIKRDVYLISHLDITQWNVEETADGKDD